MVLPTNGSEDTTPLFKVGMVVITASAEQMLSPAQYLNALRRHVRGDWGEMCEEDLKANDQALENGGRLFSSYPEGGTKFWIITESDRSATTILLPSDY